MGRMGLELALLLELMADLEVANHEDTDHEDVVWAHKHRCPHCDTVWEHPDDCAGSETDHRCPNCNTIEYLKHFGHDEPHYKFVERGVYRQVA